MDKKENTCREKSWHSFIEASKGAECFIRD